MKRLLSRFDYGFIVFLGSLETLKLYNNEGKLGPDQINWTFARN